MASLDQPQTWEEWGKVDEEFTKMMADNVPRRFPPVDFSKLPSLRKAWAETCADDMALMLKAAADHVSAEEISIPVGHGTELRAIVFKPSQSIDQDDRKALVVLIHGGGFLFGAPEMEASACIDATRNYRCITISLSYRLSPEAKFPVAYEDCWGALQWIAANAHSLGADLTKGFVLGGTSSGGQLTAAISHMARDRELSPPLTGIYLNATSIAAPEIIAERYGDLYRSRNTNDGKTGLSKKTTDVFNDAVKPDATSELWNPLIWHSGHKNLPRTYFQVCGADIQRDDSLVYERVLRLEHGVETRLDIYPGLPHVFWYLYPGHSATEKFRQDRLKGLEWLLVKQT
ncbi:hypothetical protein VMCG_10803 [Cytospora schulzeri]|uniref:Alpha/beta hydrolase fold-3 domain-containing protein n=1 Tax=Cytospora schulzeri TaxID=448051 RepID=A0A423V7U6_9PEZI|nr:hypothetical protein VMCG_10803 [Valsa malicola]